MDTENNENQDSQIPEGDDNTEAQEVDYKSKYEEIEQKNKELYARLKKKKSKGEKKSKKSSKKEGKVNVEQELQKIKLKISNPTLTDSQIDKAFAFSQVEGTTPQDVVKSDYFQAYTSQSEKQAQDSKATPPPSNRSGSTDRSDFTNMSEEQLLNFVKSSTPEQYEKYKKWRSGSEGGVIGSGMKLYKKRNI